ncbi:hypothetical protein KSC_001990 [Ktedonobacter sp. SOSP1-52]|nr:hypothetical protein KSC_001990 [Ktedonobacter sp. SOSP1-52]
MISKGCLLLSSPAPERICHAPPNRMQGREAQPMTLSMLHLVPLVLQEQVQQLCKVLEILDIKTG